MTEFADVENALALLAQTERTRTPDHFGPTGIKLTRRDIYERYLPWFADADKWEDFMCKTSVVMNKEEVREEREEMEARRVEIEKERLSDESRLELFQAKISKDEYGLIYESAYWNVRRAQQDWRNYLAELRQRLLGLGPLAERLGVPFQAAYLLAEGWQEDLLPGVRAGLNELKSKTMASVDRAKRACPTEGTWIGPFTRKEIAGALDLPDHRQIESVVERVNVTKLSHKQTMVRIDGMLDALRKPLEMLEAKRKAGK